VTLTSWSIHREDVLLARALHHVDPEDGFYIDVGANNPNEDSVTRLFYDRGWHGLNVEPSLHWYERLVMERPRDINIRAAVSDRPGSLVLYDHPDGGLGTVVGQYAERHLGERGVAMQQVEVDAVTLTSLCERYCPPVVHFLKIDVEGFEEQVIRGMDFSRFRPWILCIEATEPMRLNVMTHHAWDPLLIGADYRFVQFDSQNRWYVAAEHPELMSAFDHRFDDYIHWTYKRQLDELKEEIRKIQDELDEARGSRPALSSETDFSVPVPTPGFLDISQFTVQTTVEEGGDDCILSFGDDLRCLVFGPYLQLPNGEHAATFLVEPINLHEALSSTLTFDVAKDGERLNSIELLGEDGASRLRRGRIVLRFRNDSPAARFEFRIYASGKPYHGMLRFGGVSLE